MQDQRGISAAASTRSDGADHAERGGRGRAVVLGGPGRAEQVTLGELAVERPQRRELLERLDPLGDRAEAERVGELDDRAADRVAVAVATQIGDERGGDLDRVEREVLQRGERRRAGTEVVDDQTDTELVEASHRLLAGIAVVEQRRLGDLQPHRARREPGLADDALHLRGQRGVGELPGREVEVELERRARLPPATTPSGGTRARPSRCRAGTIVPSSSAAGQELARQQQAVLGVLPAHQRLEPRDPTGRAADDRQVVQSQLVAGDRADELAFGERASWSGGR